MSKEEWTVSVAITVLEKKLKERAKHDMAMLVFEDNLLESWLRYLRDKDELKKNGQKPSVRFIREFLNEVRSHFPKKERWALVRERIKAFLAHRVHANTLRHIRELEGSH